jgi:hypothetical protein
VKGKVKGKGKGFGMRAAIGDCSRIFDSIGLL